MEFWNGTEWTYGIQDGVAEENARLVGSGNGSVVRVEVERILGGKFRIVSRAVECENGDQTEYDSGQNAV
jgi:hypothetical protein